MEFRGHLYAWCSGRYHFTRRCVAVCRAWPARPVSPASPHCFSCYLTSKECVWQPTSQLCVSCSRCVTTTTTLTMCVCYVILRLCRVCVCVCRKFHQKVPVENVFFLYRPLVSLLRRLRCLRGRECLPQVLSRICSTGISFWLFYGLRMLRWRSGRWSFTPEPGDWNPQNPVHIERSGLLITVTIAPNFIFGLLLHLSEM